MTRTDIIAHWDRCEILAAHMIRMGKDRREVQDWLDFVAEFVRLRLEELGES